MLAATRLVPWVGIVAATQLASLVANGVVGSNWYIKVNRFSAEPSAPLTKG
jgi:hypothetical protein